MLSVQCVLAMMRAMRCSMLPAAQVYDTGDGKNNAVLVHSVAAAADTPPDPLTVVMRGGELSCYGALVLPIDALGTEYYTICAGHNQPGEISQVLCGCYVVHIQFLLP